MELSYDDIEKCIEQICAGFKVVDIDDRTIIFKYPDNNAFIMSRRVYDLEFGKSVKDGLLTNDEMKKVIEDRGFITTADKNKLISLKSKLEAQRVLLAKTVKVKANQDRVKKIIGELEDQIRIIEYKERSKYSMTAQTRSEEAKILYLCWYCCHKFEEEGRYWQLYSDFTAEKDLIFRQRVVSEFISFYSGIPTSYIRAVARSNLWRIRYVTSLKTSEPLFGVPTSKYSNDQLNLAYWSHYYQNIFEMLPEDQPSELIIQDDEALDAYIKDYYDERTKDVASRRDKRKRLGKLSAFDQQEVIVTRSNELYEDIKYDTPREAQAIKERTLINKKSAPHSQSRSGQVPHKLPTR
jgi:hypothetical protein